MVQQKDQVEEYSIDVNGEVAQYLHGYVIVVAASLLVNASEYCTILYL